jgi:hypothetical protein
LIYDYYKKIEARTSELGIIAEKAIEFREFFPRELPCVIDVIGKIWIKTSLPFK